jgi:hypothetical protein
MIKTKIFLKMIKIKKMIKIHREKILMQKMNIKAKEKIAIQLLMNLKQV